MDNQEELPVLSFKYPALHAPPGLLLGPIHLGSDNRSQPNWFYPSLGNCVSDIRCTSSQMLTDAPFKRLVFVPASIMLCPWNQPLTGFSCSSRVSGMVPGKSSNVFSFAGVSVPAPEFPLGQTRTLWDLMGTDKVAKRHSRWQFQAACPHLAYWRTVSKRQFLEECVGGC